MLFSTLNFNKLEGLNIIRDSFVGPFTITRLIGKNSVEVKLSEEFSGKHPVLPVSLITPCQQTREDKLPSRNQTHSPQDIVEVEDSPGPEKKGQEDHTQ
ncbi:hypothetical protein O181_007828 [Austropuccinia psidii MF-1]|uniref:Uncharacterized protein n=1 Tax=Austropuccinia psidii MF-1 TaxID=1389203 RepID=A0A9Q3GHZ3_9BASI|nr:hypothetical protein [Austropuccinia psidii MF-1]